MQDKLAKRILEYMREHDSQIMYAEPRFSNAINELGIDANTLKSAVPLLLEKGDLLEITDHNKRVLGVTLSYKQRRIKEFRRIAVAEYLGRNWIAIAAFIIAFVSLLRTF